MAKRTKTDKTDKKTDKAESKPPLVWTRVGELEVAYSGEKLDKVYLRQALQPIGVRALTAELEDTPLSCFVAAAPVYALDRAALKSMIALFPKAKR